jgi:uncharacterized lipoprotein YmbA
MKIHRLVQLGCALIATGCASAPAIHYFTLDMTPSGRVPDTVAVTVANLQTSDALSRPGIKIAASATRVEYYATQRWAGSVGELVTQKLNAELDRGSNHTIPYLMTGTVLALEQVDTDDGAEARVRLAVEIREPTTREFEPPLVERTYEATRKATRATPDAVVIALSRALEDIAVEIAKDLDGHSRAPESADLGTAEP